MLQSLGPLIRDRRKKILCRMIASSLRI